MMSVDDQIFVRESIASIPNVGVPKEGLIRLILDIMSCMASDVELLDRQKPGHRFGKDKFRHQVETVSEAADWIPIFGFYGAEIACFLLVCCCHDWGRTVEILRGLQTLRPGVRHGQISAEMLLEHRFYDRLGRTYGTEIADCVMAALVAHAEATADLEEGSLAWRIAYALRDIDKINIIADSFSYFTPPGMTKQFCTHYLPTIVAPLNHQAEDFKGIVEEFCAEFLAGNTEPKDGFFGAEHSVQQAVFEIFNAEIPEDLIDAFCAGNQLDIRRVKDGWGAHMLWHMSLVFDAHHPMAVATILGNPLYNRRVEFVCSRVSPENADRIRAKVKEVKTQAGL